MICFPVTSSNSNINKMKLFYDGTAFLTTSLHNENDPEIHISFEEIVQPKNLKQAFLTAMCMEFDWLTAQLPASIPINFYSDYDKKTKRTKEIINENWTLDFPVFPSYLSFGAMHAKLMVLVFDAHARIVISSANLMSFDYELVENIVFIQDFPLFTAQDTEFPPVGKSCDFVKRIIRFTRFLPNFFFPWMKYDWSKAKAIPIVSLPGSFPIEGSVFASGHLQLKECFLKHHSQIASIEIQATSFGRITNDWLHQILCSVAGKDYENRVQIRIVYPTQRYTKESPLGQGAFGTVFMKSEYYEKSQFLHKHMHQCVSHRKGSPMHSKIIAAYDKAGELLCIYFGSHNFSQAAWGKLTLRTGKVAMNNYEIGVFCEGEQAKDVPLPFISPAPKYDREDVPWFNPS